MTEKLSKSKRQQLKQLVIDCEIQRFSTSESLSYIKDKLGVTLSDRHFYRVKRQITEEAGDQLDYLSKTRSAYVANYFERIHEGYRYQRELWKIFHSEKDRNCQLKCLRNLKEVSVYLADLYSFLPNLAGITFSETTGNDNNISGYKFGEGGGTGQEHWRHIGTYSKDCSVCEEQERKF